MNRSGTIARTEMTRPVSTGKLGAPALFAGGVIGASPGSCETPTLYAKAQTPRQVWPVENETIARDIYYARPAKGTLGSNAIMNLLHALFHRQFSPPD